MENFIFCAVYGREIPVKSSIFRNVIKFML